MKLFHLCVLAVAIFSFQSAFAQSSIDLCTQWRDYTNAGGSASIALDGKYVWLGTTGGLIRFDTTTNEHELFLKTNSGLPVNWVEPLVLDRTGALWVGTFEGGLARYENGVWTKFNTSNSGLPGMDVISLAVDSSGNIWIGTDNGLAEYSYGIINQVPTNLPASDNAIYAIAVDQSGTLWIGANDANNDGAVDEFDGTYWTLFTYNNSTIQNQSVTAIACALDGTVWVGFWNGVIEQFDGSNWTAYVVQPSFGGSCPVSIAIDDSNDIWIADYLGVGELRNYQWQTFSVGSSAALACSGAETWVAKDPGLAKIHDSTWDSYSNFSNCTLVSNEMRPGAITVDQKGNTWALAAGGAGEQSCNAAVGHDTSWQTIFPTGYSDPLGNSGAWSLCADSSGNVWMGISTMGVARFDGTNWYYFNDTNSGIFSNSVESIAYDKKYKRLWMAGDGCGYFDGTTWKDFTPTDMGFPGYIEIDCIAFDTAGNVWMGAPYEGISKFDGTSWQYFSTANSGLPDDFITGAACQRSGAVWIGTNGGLAEYANGTWTVFTTSNSPLPCSVSAVAVDSEDHVWMGTGGCGAALYDHGKWAIFNQDNSGLTNWNITNIVVDSHDGVWFAMEYAGMAEYRKAGFQNDSTLALFRNDTLTACDSNALSAVMLTGDGCSNRHIVSQTIVGKDSAYYTIVHPADTGTAGNDSISIQFSPDSSRTYDATLVILLQDSTMLTVPLSSTGKATSTLSLASSDRSCDTIGGTVTVPIIVAHSALLTSANLALAYDTSMLVYQGTQSRAGLLADATIAPGRAQLSFQALDPQSGDTIAFASFAVYPTHSCAEVTFDSLTYTSQAGACVTLANPSAVSDICSSIVCGTSILSNVVRYGSIPVFEIAPNPASSATTLTSNLPVGNTLIEMVDCVGAVKQSEVSTLGPDHSIALDIHNLPEGAYFVRVTSTYGNTDASFTKVIPFMHF